jgi:hypothetical protein
MSFLLQRSLTTGLSTTVGYHLFPSRIEALSAALKGDGRLAGTAWSVDVLAQPAGGAEIDICHEGQAFARGWLCFDPTRHEALWRTPSLRATSSPADEPTAGPWLLTFQWPHGADLSRKDPPLRLEARQLLGEAAWAIMGPAQAPWTVGERP